MDNVLGFVIHTEKSPGSGLDVYLQNEEHGFLLRIPVNYLKFFGYHVAGCELGVIQREPAELPEGITLNDIVAEILSEQYQKRREVVTYEDLKDFYSQEEFKTKKAANAFKECLNYIDEHYQRVWKSCLKRAKEHKLS